MAVSIDGVEIPEERIKAHFEMLCARRDEMKARDPSSVAKVSDDVLRDWAEENIIEEMLFVRDATLTQPIPADKHIQQELANYPDMYKGLKPEDARVAAVNALQIARAKKQIYKKVPVPTDAECKAVYDAHLEDFRTEKNRIISELVMPISGEMDQTHLYVKMLNLKASIGTDYGKWIEAVVNLSANYPDDKGLFGIISNGDGQLPNDVEEQLFALPANGISEPIDLGDGNLYLFSNIPLKENHTHMPFEMFKESIRGALIHEGREKAMDAHYNKLKAAAKIIRSNDGAADKKDAQA